MMIEVGLLEQIENSAKGVAGIQNKLRKKLSPESRIKLQNQVKRLARLHRNSLNCLQG